MSCSNTIRVIIGAALATAAAACGSDATGPGDQQLDLPAVLAQMSTNSFTDASGSALGISTPSTANATVVPSACVYSAATQGFNCPTRTVDGLSFSASYYLFDANGNPQTAPSSTTTASVRLVTDLAGTVTQSVSGTSSSITMKQRNDFTMSGLLTSQHVLTGTSVNHDSTVVQGASLSRIVDDLTSTAQNIVLPPPGSANRWPQSGAVVSDLTGQVTLGALGPLPATLHAVLTFNGTNLVPLTVSGTLTNSCTIDLSGKSAPACSQ